jgi:hypothetical protein
MLRKVPIVLAADKTAPPPTGAPGSRQERSGQERARPALNFSKLGKPLKPTPHPLPRLRAASLDFILRLCLYARMIYVVFKMR